MPIWGFELDKLQCFLNTAVSSLLFSMWTFIGKAASGSVWKCPQLCQPGHLGAHAHCQRPTQRNTHMCTHMCAPTRKHRKPGAATELFWSSTCAVLNRQKSGRRCIPAQLGWAAVEMSQDSTWSSKGGWRQNQHGLTVVMEVKGKVMAVKGGRWLRENRSVSKQSSWL